MHIRSKKFIKEKEREYLTKDENMHNYCMNTGIIINNYTFHTLQLFFKIKYVSSKEKANGIVFTGLKLAKNIRRTMGHGLKGQI